jgi:hypothetical protein
MDSSWRAILEHFKLSLQLRMTAAPLRSDKRRAIIDALAERGIEFSELSHQVGQPDADPFDLLCHLAFNAPSLRH